MSFKWDWEKRELVEGERPKGLELPEWTEPFILPALGGFMWVFIQYIAPWLGHIFFGGFL
jgi:hypothetical protein